MVDKRARQSKLQLRPLDLVATTVHELKTPLTLITGFATMLEAEQFGSLNSQQRRYINRITQVSERLLVLVESLLTISKSQHHRLQLQREPVSVSSVVKIVLEELETTITTNRMKIKWLGYRHVEPVLADRDCLYQIIYNLIDNSLKYSPAATTITIKVRHQGGNLYLRISDQGIGIKPTDLKYLFRRFSALAQPVGNQAGSSGLGLYIVKRLVEVQGGRIQARSLHKGTCFIVQLPLAQQLNLFAEPKRAPQPKLRATPALLGKS